MKNDQNSAVYKNLQLYEGVRGLAVKILNRIDRTDAYMDKLLEIEIKNSDLEGPDKALLFEIVHGVIRWLGRIDWILNGFYKGQFSKCIPNVKNAMRVALYQILWLDKIPDYAAVNEAVDFVKKLQGQKPADLTNAVLRNIIRSKNGIRYANPDEDLVTYLSAYYSHPVWLVKRWLNRYGREFTEQLMIANNNKPVISLRVNKLKTNKKELEELLTKVKQGYDSNLYHDNFISLSNLTNIADWEYFSKGYFALQDESTWFSIKFLDVKPGMRVLDMCAAPGGKTGALAEVMNNEGEIVAIDRYEARMDILKTNLDRLGVKNLTTVVANAADYKDEKGFDKILLDAPCSGLGTLTKKPDIKWKKEIVDLHKITSVQKELLKKAAELVKVGGEIVYSTCTIEPDENFEIVNSFLFEHQNFKLVKAEDYFDKKYIDTNGCVQTYPHLHQMDGAFAAKIERIY